MDRSICTRADLLLLTVTPFQSLLKDKECAIFFFFLVNASVEP